MRREVPVGDEPRELGLGEEYLCFLIRANV